GVVAVAVGALVAAVALGVAALALWTLAAAVALGMACRGGGRARSAAQRSARP
ncbi:MAG: hypothetical protein HY908_29200, partial [Myxococcales bacterium]|nr:hypothetical protein [Myxococcales bacterium]